VRLRSYQRDLRYRIGIVRGWAGTRTLDDIPEIAEQIKRQGSKAGMSPAGINRVLSILRRIGNLAVRWGWTDKPLGQRIGMVPGEGIREVYLSPEQVRHLLTHVDDPEARDLVLFAALTGMRRGEILSLQPDQIHGDAVILTSRTKSGRPRYVPLPPQAIQIARSRLPWTIPERRLTSVWQRARKAAGMPGVRLHDLRHSFASWLAASGTPMTNIRDILGHSSLAVTSRYSHAARPDLDAAVSKLKV
jgi:integrase